jgi:heptosyltransferase-1
MNSIPKPKPVLSSASDARLIPAARTPEKILLIKLAAVGDLVCASAFFEALRKRFQDSEIQLLVGRSCHQIAVNNPSFDRLIVADDTAIYRGTFAEKLRECFRLVSLIRRGGFDRVYVMHRAWPFRALAWLAGIPVRVGLARRRAFSGLTHAVVSPEQRNEREVYLDLLRATEGPLPYAGSRYWLSLKEEAFCDRFFAGHAIAEDEIVIAVAPGGGDNVKSSMPIRRWPWERFARLTEKIVALPSLRVILVGGPMDQERAARIREECPEAIDATHLTFGEMASVFRRCKAFVGNDSGPLHIASAMGLATVALYGPTDPEQWADTSTTILSKPTPCAPCYHDGHFPACQHLSCLTAIEVEDAFEALNGHLSLSALTPVVK